MNITGIIRRITRMKEIGIIVPTILLIIIAQFTNSVFLSGGNLLNILRATGFTIIAALGFTMVLISGGLDLSVGSVLALGGVTAATLLQFGLPIPAAILGGVLSGAVTGAVNGLIIVYFDVPPLIMSLGMMYMARGIVFIITEGVPVYPLPEGFHALEQSDILGFPTVVVFAAILALLIHFMLRQTRFGREIFATGGNKDTANLSGIDTKKVTISVYVITGLLAAFTGIMMTSRLGSAQPGAGTGYEMTVASATIIGGTSLFGGAGTVLGTVIGAFFMSSLSNSMTLMRVSVFWQNLIVGAILVIAVIIDQYNRKRLLRA